MTVIQNTVRWADNTAELRKNLLDGVDTIDAMRTAVDRTVRSMGGDGLFGAANKLTAAITELGGTTKLTTAEQERALGTLDRAIEKYHAMGLTAPSAMVDVRNALKETTTAWEDFVGHLSIEGILEHPFETLKGGAAAFAETLGPLGVTALETVGAVAALGVAIFELTEKAAGVGGAIYDMHLKTGLSVVSASQLSAAMKIAGTDAETLTNAVFMMEKRFDDTGPAGDKVRNAVTKLGLSVEEFKAMDPEQKVLALSDAFRALDPAVSKAGLVFDIFGRQGREILPTLLKPLGELIDKGKELGVTWSEDDAKAAEEFEMQVRALKLAFDTLFVTLGKELIPAVVTLTEWFQKGAGFTVEWVGKLSGLSGIFGTIGSVVSTAAAALDVLTGNTGKLPPELAKLSSAAEEAAHKLQEMKDNAFDAAHTADKDVAAWKANATALTGFGGAALIGASGSVELKLAQDRLTASAEASIAVHKKAAEEQKKLQKQQEEWQKVLTDLNSAGDGWRGTLEGIDGEVQAAVRYYLDAGVAQSVLARAYDLTEAQVRAVSEAMKEEKKWIDEISREHEVTLKLAQEHEKQWRDEQAKLLKKSNEDTAASIQETGRLWNQYYDNIAHDALSTKDYQRLQIQEWFENEVAKLKDDDANWLAHYNALYALAQQKMAEITGPMKKFQDDSRKLLDDVEGGWVDTFSNILVHTGSFTEAAKGVWKGFKDETLNIFADLLGGIIHSFLDALLKAVEEYVAKMLVKLAILAVFKIFGFSSGGMVPGLPGDGATGGGDSGDNFSTGGMVYAAGGWPSRGTDTVPAMLSPGEVVLNAGQQQNVADQLGRGAGSNVIDLAAFREEQAGTRAAVESLNQYLQTDFPRIVARAAREASQDGRRRPA